MGKQGNGGGNQGGMNDLHEMRQKAHEMGIEGSSKMDMNQLRDAMKKVNKGQEPMMAKQEARRKM
jgi:hypothetical protein